MTVRSILPLALLIAATAATAQPAAPANSDLAPVPAGEAAYGTASPAPAAPAPTPAAPQPAPAAQPATPPIDNRTYAEKDVINAAEGAFGKGAEGLAGLIEKIFKENGRPTAYIEGREVGGAVIVGLRYGSGVLHHKVEGDMPVYWTGPSIGLDLGGDGSKTFALVYNLDNTADLFKRYPAAEGKVYAVGGFTANYLQRGRVIVVPVKLGVGWRLGANVGYLKFTKESKLQPF